MDGRYTLNWNPDQRWPEHIIGLTKDIARGKDVRAEFKDAFEEEGLFLCAKNVDILELGVLPIRTQLTKSVFSMLMPLIVLLAPESYYKHRFLLQHFPLIY